ncbi:MAG: actin-like protein arp8 [Thelocarpon superellum]|nr:MAG: actin-like protein arp8 [Thelocarpon superellum]
MVGKKSGKALLREEGLERTDNNMTLTSWPVVGMINQKNYYTEYLKRDDQMLVLRLQNEEARNQMTKAARDRDRALAQSSRNELALPDRDVEMKDAAGEENGENAEDSQEALGSKVIVIHPGSQNLRIGLANTALPKTTPMVVARRWSHNESEEAAVPPKPKRVKVDEEDPEEPEQMFGNEFAEKFTAMSAQLKKSMRDNKRRLLPNSKELVINYNRRTPPETISEHNDPLRVDWTEVPADPKAVPDFFTGHAALRIPDDSSPRYKLFWPLQLGTYNEADYATKTLLCEDIAVIIEEAMKSELGLRRRKDWAQYSCVFVIPDLYERNYVASSLEMLLRDFNFARVCFIQESLAATFGSGYSTSCIVDIGAQKTSICCVEEGTCLENSRVNLKYGGADVTEAFVKMMLFDYFPYADINLRRRYDFLLAEELKQKFCTMNEADISVQLYDFHLRASGQDTRKYTFKTYDEVLLAPMGYFQPAIFDNEDKLRGRRTLIDRSYDLYDGAPNDPTSTAQIAIYTTIHPAPETNGTDTQSSTGPFAMGLSGTRLPLNHASRFNDSMNAEHTPRSSVAGSPAPENASGTPQPGPGVSSPAPAGNSAAIAPGTTATTTNTAATNANNAAAAAAAAAAALVESKIVSAEQRDAILAIYPLDLAILTSISNSTSTPSTNPSAPSTAPTTVTETDERKTREFLGGIMVIGGGAGPIPGFHTHLEERLRALRPGFAKDVMVGTPPRELDPTVVVWKGASVFGKLSGTNDAWIGRLEYDRLGSRVLAYKCMWAW